jgi:GTP-binding protein
VIRPVVAIVGRPNVGKSTLFNRLVGRRQSLVRDVPGVTRDRLYGTLVAGTWQATVVDTGGFEPDSTSDLVAAMGEQIKRAIEEADLVLFVVDARAGVTPLDGEIARVLRRSGRPVVLAANKIEGAAQEAELGDAYRLGFGEVQPISAEHGRGVAELVDVLRARAPESASAPSPGGLRVAIVGRPNVGKSSLVNAVLGEPRVLVHDAPGTTRDAVDTPVTFGGQPYVLIDTAGIRRKGRVTEALEKLSVVMALRGLERCDVAVLMVDASEGVTAQDAHIAGYAHEAGRALVLAVNKWDLVPPGLVQKADVVGQIHDRLPFADYAPVCFTSALRAEGLDALFHTVAQVGAEARRRLNGAELLTVVRQAVERRPQSWGGIPLRVHSIQQVGIAPPTFALKVSVPPTSIHFSYERYLVNSLRHTFGLAGSPVRLLFRAAPRKARPRRGAPATRRRGRG